MFDHAREEEPIEISTLRPREVRHLLGREHAGHQGRAGHPMCARGRDLLAADFQPALHHLDLVLLRHVDPQGELLHVLAAGPRRDQGDHLHGLRVVADHPLHELDVRPDVLDLRQIGRLLGGDDAARLARGARLDDGRARRDGRRAWRDAGCAASGPA